jgi:hypothetical protein
MLHNSSVPEASAEAVSKSDNRHVAYHVASAGVAQLVERVTCNDECVGSSPTSGLGRKRLLEVSPEGVDVIEPNAEADQIVRHTAGLPPRAGLHN